MKQFISLVLLIFGGCATKQDQGSYYLIDSVNVVSCSSIEKMNNRLYVYNNEFNFENDSISFIFSIVSLIFVNEKGKKNDQDLSNAGNLGSYDAMRAVKVLLRNKNYKKYIDVSDFLIFDTSLQKKSLFFLNELDAKRALTLYNDTLNLGGAKVYKNFDFLSDLINSRDSTIAHRNLIRPDIKPFIRFSIPKHFLSWCQNDIFLKLYFDSYNVTTVATITLK